MAGLVVSIALLLGIVALYAGLCLVLLFYVTLPEDPPYDTLEDAIFVFTGPFVGALLLASYLRSWRTG